MHAVALADSYVHPCSNVAIVCNNKGLLRTGTHKQNQSVFFLLGILDSGLSWN